MTPEEIQQAKQDLQTQGYKPPVASSDGSDWHSRIKSRFDKPERTLITDIKSVAQDPIGSAKALAGGVAKGAGVEFAGSAIDWAGRKAIEALPNTFQVAGVTKQQMLENLSKAPSINEQFEKNQSMDVHPNLAATGEVAGFVGSVGPALVAKAPQILAKGKELVKPVSEALAKRSAIKAESSTIEAVNPDLTGKKLEGAYQQVVKGDRTITPSGIFTEQTLSPSDRAIKVGKRLASGDILSDGTKIESVLLDSNHVKNLPKLKTALTNTETKLQTALKGDPEINFNADRQTLFKTLDDAVKSAPEEYRIKGTENSQVYQSVFNFANKVASKADDSILGIREARKSFDNQAKLEFPSAFKDGAIDVKSPAGAAIKKARDIFNEHLYNTAPNGSDIQKLIGHEADIYQATEHIAAKASKGEGMTKVQKVSKAIKEHPVASAASTVGLYEAGKNALGY